LILGRWVFPDFYNHEKIESRVFYKKASSLALPIALQIFVASSLNLVDSLMVGHLGETELASVGIGIQPFFIFWMVLFGFTGGCNTFVAQFFGIKDMKSIRKVTGFGITVCLIAGVVFFTFSLAFTQFFASLFTDNIEAKALACSYIRIGAPVFLVLPFTVPLQMSLRATQQPKIPLAISLVAFSTNTILNYMLIFGHFGFPRMGVSGAALATVIARALELLLVIIVVFGRKNIIAGPVKEFLKWNKELAIRVFKNSTATTINEVSWGLGMTVCNMAYARAGITAYAAVRASLTIFDLFIMFAFSIGDAALIILGEYLGRGERQYAIGASKKFVKLGLITGIVSGTLLLLLAEPLLSFYQFSDVGWDYAYKIIIVFALTMWVDLYGAIMITGVFRGGGDTRFAMITEVGTVWLIAVPLAFLGTLVFHLPIYLVILIVRLENFIKALIVTKRWVSCKWANTVIKGV